MLPPEALSFRGFHCQYNIWQENQVMMPFRRGNLLVFVVPENLDADFGGERDAGHERIGGSYDLVGTAEIFRHVVDGRAH